MSTELWSHSCQAHTITSQPFRLWLLFLYVPEKQVPGCPPPTVQGTHEETTGHRAHMSGCLHTIFGVGAKAICKE